MRAIDAIVSCAVICVAGCGTPTVASADVTAGSATNAPAPRGHPDDNPACADLARLTSIIHRWQVAADPQPHRIKAMALWPTVPPACRGGTFFLAAAEIVSIAGDDKPTTVDGAVVVHSPAEALERGLAAESDHPRLLAHLALVDDLAPSLHAPPLPVDSCARAKGRGSAWTDDAAYVCALVAIHASDGVAALSELDRVRDVGRFPDLKGRRAQALALAGKRKEARALAKPAAAALATSWPFDIPDSAIATLKKRLAAL